MCFIKKKDYVEKFVKKARNFDEFESKEYEKLVGYLKNDSKVVEQCHQGLKLVVISDTHGDLAFGDRFKVFMDKITEYDICLILGDIYVYELDKICEIIPPEKILAIRGNHDRFDIYDKHRITNINGKVYSVKGIKIAGIEGSNRYKNEEAPLYTHYESLYLACKMKQEADLLITHDIPFMESKYDKAHEGMVGITYYIYKNGVKVHIHGHIHKSYRTSYDNGTNEISVYGCEYVEI